MVLGEERRRRLGVLGNVRRHGEDGRIMVVCSYFKEVNAGGFMSDDIGNDVVLGLHWTRVLGISGLGERMR